MIVSVIVFNILLLILCGECIMFSMSDFFTGKIFKISVIATVSSGKSTFVNSIVGTDFLPSANEACTSKLITLIHSNNNKERSLIFQRKDSYQKIDDFNVSLLSQLNDDPAVNNIFIKCNLPFIRGVTKPVAFIDTPGVNNSLSDSHGKTTYDYINKLESGLVIYVVNATQIGICDDRQLLDKVIDRVIEQGGKLKIIFVVNKVDEFDFDKELLSEVLADVRSYINDCVMYKPRFIHITADDFRIFPVSSITAKVIRKKFLNAPTTRFENKLLNKAMTFLNDEHSHFERFASLSARCRHYTEDRLAEFSYMGSSDFVDLNELLIHTGIPAVEETINEYISAFDSLKD